ncbi:hypothetical protein FB451DRAFT_1302617 [Mycena latifolia]|nr:hypothetical protein FB451DRAFT_1302617 [Mycena latifolia]
MRAGEGEGEALQITPPRVADDTRRPPPPALCLCAFALYGAYRLPLLALGFARARAHGRGPRKAPEHVPALRGLRAASDHVFAFALCRGKRKWAREKRLTPPSDAKRLGPLRTFMLASGGPSRSPVMALDSPASPVHSTRTRTRVTRVLIFLRRTPIL